MTDAPDTPTWDDLKDLIRWFAVLFGEPREIWDQWAAARPLALTMRGWLLALEAIARALLLTMAAGLARPAPPAATASARRRDAAPAREDAGICDPDAGSDRWLGVSFRLAPPQAPDERRPWREPRFEQRRSFFVRSLAFRFEAVIRVAENPHRYAVRMAKRLPQNPKLVERVLRRPNPPNCSRSFPNDDLTCAQNHARMAARAFVANTG